MIAGSWKNGELEADSRPVRWKFGCVWKYLRSPVDGIKDEDHREH